MPAANCTPPLYPRSCLRSQHFWTEPVVTGFLSWTQFFRMRRWGTNHWLWWTQQQDRPGWILQVGQVGETVWSGGEEEVWVLAASAGNGEGGRGLVLQGLANRLREEGKGPWWPNLFDRKLFLVFSIYVSREIPYKECIFVLQCVNNLLRLLTSCNFGTREQRVMLAQAGRFISATVTLFLTAAAFTNHDGCPLSCEVLGKTLGEEGESGI